MPRQLPEEWRGKDVPDVTRKTDSYITEVREYELITPLFGGGVETQQADPVTVVRATEVRGQLRFWWRATRGGQFGGSLEKMKAAEDAIWGSTDQASQVQVSILQPSAQSKQSPYYVRLNRQGRPSPYSRDNIAPAYASFPLQPDQNHLVEGYESPPVQIDVVFQLSLSYPTSCTPDVAAALWAWEIFGGLGARTRRGFGSISPKNITDLLPAAEFVKDLNTGLQKHVASGDWPKGVPHLSRSIDLYRVITIGKAGENFNTAQQSWTYLIGQLKNFRQQRDPAPPENRYQPGRSRWPEPDSIRLHMEDRGRGHPYHQPRLRFKKYPRSAFGLPIEVKFKTQDERRGDPPKTTVRGRGTIDRLASPLILRPINCQSEGRKVHLAIAVVLKGPRLPPGGLALKVRGDLEPISGESLDPNEAHQILRADTNEPLLGNETDVLRAFLNYLEGK
jgi:CRISPR-associated protein Cmr1